MPKESPHLYIIKLNVLASLFCFDVTADNPKSFCFFYWKLCAALQGKQQAVSLLFCKAKLAVLQGKACCFARLSLLFCKAASSQLLPCSSNIWVINFFASDFMKILMSKWNYACKYFFFAVIIIGLLSSESKFVYFKCFFCWPHVLSPMVDYSCRLDYSIRLNCNLRIFLDKWR